MKYNKKNIFTIIGLILVLVTAVTTVFASPDNNKKTVPTKNSVFSCRDGDGKVDSLSDFEAFQSTFGIEIVDKNQQIVVSVDGNKLKGVEFGVYVTYTSNNGSFANKLVSTLTISNPKFVYDYPNEAGDYIIELKMTNAGDTGCKTGDTNWTTTLSVEGTTSSVNQYYDDNVCQIIRGVNVTPSENYAFLSSYNNLTQVNKNSLKSGENAITLCTERYFNTFGVSRKMLISNVTNIVKNLELAQKLGGMDLGKDTYAERLDYLKKNGYKHVEDPSKEDGLVLSCNNYSGLTGPTEALKPLELQFDEAGWYDTDYYTSVNQGKFYHTSSETSKPNGYCKKNCVESVVASYGPPVATKGGICFEYKVKVVADMVCEAEIDYSKKPKLEPACMPTPVCNSSSEYGDQGGPTEDFDACILEKDGGQYTQDAVNACYNEVYGYDDELAEDMALVNDYNITGSPVLASYLKIGGHGGLDDAKIIQIMNEVNAVNSAGNGGKYVRDANGTISWKCTNANNCVGGSYFNLGGYYFSSPTKAFQTIYNLNGMSYGAYSGTLSGGYIIKAGGFKAGRNCQESCSWTGCSDSKFINQSDAVEDYNKELAEWNKEIEQCVGSATCSKSTSTYTMEIKSDKVDSSIKNSNSSLGSDKDNEFNKDSDTEVSGDTDMIIDSGACYGKGDTNNTYMTEWTFPKTFINNKNGDIAFDKEDVPGWREEEGKYCLPLDEPDVNTLWFDWYVNNMVRGADGKLVSKDLGFGNRNLTIEEQNEISSNIKYNIFANTTDFGHYGWNIDVQCFYASRAANPPCIGSNCNTGTGTGTGTGTDIDTKNDTVNNYKYRSITLNNINSAEADLKGFNWSEASTNRTNAGYPVVPNSLRKNIADRGNSIYESDEYLDYHFVLTTKDLQKIRKYNDNKTYLDYGNNFYTDENSGVTFYISDFLRGKTSNSLNRNSVKLIPNSKNGCNNLKDKSSCENYIEGGIVNE